MTLSYYDIFKALSAPLMLVVGAFAGLTLDLVALRRSTMQLRMRTIGTVALLSLLAAAIPVCRHVGEGGFVALHRTLLVNDLSLLFSLVIVLLTALTVVISIDADVGDHVGEYFATVLFGAVGMILLVSSEEMITVFVAVELTSLSLYILTAFQKGLLRSQEAAVKYFMFGAIASAFLLFGMSYLYGITGSTNLRIISEGVTAAHGNALLTVALLFIVVGFGFKVAVVPFHLWAPDAYEGAPTPVTAFIATGSKVASFFVLAKFMLVAFAGATGSAYSYKFVSGWTMLLALLAVASMVLGNFAAIVQRNVKRLLAYSSIAHAGYIFVGLLAASLTGATSVLFYIIVYAFTNLGAFGVITALANRAGGDDLECFNGMARRAPFISFLMLIFMLSLAGVPPLGGFFGKFYLFAAAVQRESKEFGLLWLVVIGILMSAVSLYYYLIVLKHFYVEKPKDTSKIAVPVYLLATLSAIALVVVGMGVYPEPILALLKSLAPGL
jgi:NADH-quinone oxidoreductase subunit N